MRNPVLAGLIRILILAVWAPALQTCSTKPDSNNPGRCEVVSNDCKDAILVTSTRIGETGRYEIRPMNPPEKMGCFEEDQPVPIRLDFVVAEVPDDSDDSPYQGLSNVAVGIIAGGVMSDVEGYSKGISDDQVYCTDLCGVVTVNLMARCLPAAFENTINVQVHSGSLYSKSVSFPLQIPDNESND